MTDKEENTGTIDIFEGAWHITCGGQVLASFPDPTSQLFNVGPGDEACQVSHTVVLVIGLM